MLGTTAVVEMGSGSVRAGLAGEAAPRVVRSSACASNGTRPVSKGRVVDRELWEATLHGALTDVLAGQRDERKETGLVLVHRPDEPAREKERASEFVFERCGLGLLSLADSAVVALHAAGSDTGVVVDCGYDSSHVTTVYAGHSFTDVTAFRAIDIGGEHLSRALQTSPRLAALQLTAAETNMIKEHTGRATTQYREECAPYVTWRQAAEPTWKLHGSSFSYLSLLPGEIIDRVMRYALPPAPARATAALPDGRAIGLDEEAITCVESLFEPSIATGQIDVAQEGLTQALHWAYWRSDLDVRATVCSNILLAGFADRVIAALREEVNPVIRLRVTDLPEHDSQTLSWAGASATGDQAAWISREQYEEHGPGIAHRCL